VLDGLLLTIGVYAAVLACWAASRAVRGGAPTRLQAMVALVLQARPMLHDVAACRRSPGLHARATSRSPSAT
jgi:hypothetical protein